MKSKKFLSVILALIMVLSVTTVCRAQDVATATVTVTAQSYGYFLATYFDVEVRGDASDKYNLPDTINKASGVSAADVFITLHEKMFGDDLTVSNATSDYFDYNSSGYVTKLFGEENSANGFICNNYGPNTDGIGKTITELKVETGDILEFFTYQDVTTWSDQIAWLNKNNAAVTEFTATPESEITLSVNATSYVYSAFNYADADSLHTAFKNSTVTGAQLRYVDIDTAVTTPIEDAVTDASGKVSFTAPSKEGTYYLTAYIPAEDIESGKTPLIMSLTKLTVDKNAAQDDVDPCALSSLSVKSFVSDPNTLALTPAFSKNVTSYTSAVSDYPQYDYPVWRSAYVSATAESETSVITASCNGVNVTVGNSWTLLNSALIGGKNNVLTVKVAESAAEDAASRTYTVIIPMKPKTNTLPTPVAATASKTIALGNSYTADLSKIFTDPDEIDTVTYKVSVDGTQSVGASKNYTFTPNELKNYTLVFTANDGTGDSTTYTLTLNVIQGSDQAFMLTAQSDSGDWYPTAFDKNKTDYGIYSAQSENELSFTVSEYASVEIDETVQSPDENGVYSVAMDSDKVDITVTSSDTSTVKTYSFTPILKKNGYPDKVVDFLSVNSNYTNGLGYGNADKPWLSLGGGYTSLGNFGGYITYYYTDGITDNPNNKYGIDFYVYGNAYKDESTSTKTAFFEPAQAWVSEDGEVWYALAGSAHYDDRVDREYSVTYTKTANGKTSWRDNRGNANDDSEYSGEYPSADIYTMNNLSAADSFTLSGIALPAQNGKIATVGEATDAYPVRWGYGDCFANGVLGADVNPYTDNSNFDLETNGFDLKWAVDRKGIPVDVSGKEFHYVKLVTASNIWHSSLGEKSPEISGVVKTVPQAEAVGTTAAPKGVTLSDGTDQIVVNFNAEERVYSVNVGDMKYLSVSVNGAASNDNIYVNNTRITADGVAEGFKITQQSGEKLVRILVQNGDKQPLIYILKITGTANASEDLIESVKLDVNGTARTCSTKDGINYTASVGYRISSVKINPTADTSVDVTVNGAPLADSYTLEQGENTFTIVGTKGNTTHTVTLVITKDSAPATSGKITVYFTLMGDEAHGKGEVHTFENGGLTAWISKTAISVDSPATVLDVIERALDGKYTFVNQSGNYISEIGDLAEFDNGSRSGWMYTLNGSHSVKGIAEQIVKQGDKIVLHYTDDYTLEESKMSSAGSASSSSKDDNLKTDTVINGNNATVTVDKNSVSSAISEALKSPSTDNAVTVSASDTKTATTVSVEIPVSGAKEISLNNLAAEIETNCGKVFINATALKEITQQSGDKIVITVTLREDKNSAETDEKTVVADVTVSCGGKNITSFGGGTITVKVPVDKTFEQGNFYKAYIISDDGSREATYGKCVSENGKLFVSVTTSHLSKIVVSDVLTAPFKDVAEHDLADGINYAYINGIMQGTGKDIFAPDEYMTRAQLVTVLYRTEKAEKPLASNKFADVPQNEWYTDAVVWAEKEGIVKGISETEFAPEENITREQFALIIFRYAQFKGFDTSVSAELDVFEDSQSISPWAEQAFAWAYGTKLIMGIGENVAGPLGNASRAQVATILMRFCNAYAK